MLTMASGVRGGAFDTAVVGDNHAACNAGRRCSHARTPALHANMHITTNKYPSWHLVDWNACGLHVVAA